MKRKAFILLSVTVAILSAVVLCPPRALSQTSQAEEASQQLEEVMGDPLFSRWELRRARSSTGDRDAFGASSWLEPYGKWSGDRIEAFFDWLFNRGQNAAPLPSASGNTSGGGAWFGSFGELLKFFGWIVLLGTVLLIGWMLFSQLRGHRRTASRAVPDRQMLDTAMDQADALIAESNVWAKHAQTLVHEDNLRLAFRAMYLALLSGLHQAGKIRYRPQRTNGAYVRGYRGQDDERAIFAGLTDRFGEVWYGQHVPDEAAFAQVSRKVESLLGATSEPHDRGAEPAGERERL